MNKDKRNPFQITTPEDLSAKEAVSLFVDEYTDLSKITVPGHIFLTGPRGVGKSMMFRYLQADCQCLVQELGTENTDGSAFSQIPFFGVYIPIKNWSLVKTELKRLEDRHASELFNEHLMVTRIAAEVFNSLVQNDLAMKSIHIDSLLKYYKKNVLPLVADEINISQPDESSIKDILLNIMNIMNQVYILASKYAKSLSFQSCLPTYSGPLFDYQDFLVPLLGALSQIEGFPKGTVFLLIDDAHFLTEVQTRILNSWIATRTSRKVSLKVSSQYNYKNYYTVTGQTIDSPHDFTEIDLTSIYTTDNRTANYKKRVYSIVQRRLKLCNIDVTPEQFFPGDKKQEEEIKEIAEWYKKRFDQGEGKGNHRTDDAYRYARPDYIKSLSGKKKSSSSYSYAGFDQLVHLSSGIVRYFLEPAYIMYAHAVSESDKEIRQISPMIQTDVVRKEAENFLYKDIDRYKKEGHPNAVSNSDLQNLSHLIDGLGGLFRQILLSDRSERRVFSIAISDELTDDVEHILNIGVSLGYFHRSTIGRKNKKSGGRTKLFIMNRRLAPLWTLDPTGFAGYLFVRNAVLKEGIQNPQRLLRRIERKGILQINDIEYHQLNLFSESDEMDESILNL